LHDPERELRLSGEDLVAGIARGRATIPLSKLAARYPDVFQSPRSPAADVAVYLPLQKVLRQLSKASSRPGGQQAPPSSTAPAHLHPGPARLETTIAPAQRALPPEVAQTLLKPSLHGDLHGLAASTPPAAPPDEKLPAAVPLAATVAPQISERADEPPPPSSPAPAQVREATQPEAATASPPPVPLVHHPPAAVVEKVGAVEITAPPVSAVPEEPAELAGSRSEATPPESPVKMERATEGPQESALHESSATIADEAPAPAPAAATATPSAQAPDAAIASPPIAAPAEEPRISTPPYPAVSPPLFAPETLRSIDSAPPSAPTPTVPLPFFAAEAPAPPRHAAAAPAPRVAPPPLRVPPPAESAPVAAVAPAPSAPPVHDPRTNAAPGSAPAVPLRIAPMPATVRPPAINLYAGVHIQPSSEPLEEAEPENERPTRPPEPGPVTETFFTPEPQAYAPPVEDEAEPEPSPIITTPVPPPPAAPMIEYPLERIEQAPLQAIFMTEDTLDLPRISELSAELPGVSGCLILAGESLAQGGERPAGLNAQTLRDLSDRLTAAAESVSDKLQADRTFTLYGGSRALSLFARQQLCLCVVHGNRGFLPGVRERLTAVADTLARGMETAEE
jgi:hypothetical protein